MSSFETIQRVTRETVSAYDNEFVMQAELEESAISTLMIEVRAGRLDIDVEKALRSEIRKVVEADGRAADGIIRRMASGSAPLISEDLDVIVTLGAGRRKSWGAVTKADLEDMNEIRYKNYRSARESFQEFNANVLTVQGMFGDYATVADAFDAGAFENTREAA